MQLIEAPSKEYIKHAQGLGPAMTSFLSHRTINAPQGAEDPHASHQQWLNPPYLSDDDILRD